MISLSLPHREALLSEEVYAASRTEPGTTCLAVQQIATGARPLRGGSVPLTFQLAAASSCRNQIAQVHVEPQTGMFPFCVQVKRFHIAVPSLLRCFKSARSQL